MTPKIIFSGFQENKRQFTGIPEQFFSELMPAISDINELKLVFYLLWSAYRQGDYATAFNPDDLLSDAVFIKGLTFDESDLKSSLFFLLNKLVADNILITVGERENIHYYINSPRGRAAAELSRAGSLFGQQDFPKPTLDSIKPGIFKLYEDNIGPLTPLIADTLKDAIESYPEAWIEEAIRIAVTNNVRRWNYISRILMRWQEEGRDGTNRKNDPEDYRRYLKGEYGEFGSH